MRLLVSVRSASEAVDALAGGAEFIDIKEPDNGPLGRASTAVVDQVLVAVAGCTPVSMALGEWSEARDASVPQAVCNVKFGLAGAGQNWKSRADEICQAIGTSRVVITAYADHKRSDAPSVAEVAEYAVERGLAGFLIDTAIKDGSNLFDWLDPDHAGRVIDSASATGVLTALAGSLCGEALTTAVNLAPDIVAVRGAACVGGRRLSRVDRDQVRTLATVISARTHAGAIHAG